MLPLNSVWGRHALSEKNVLNRMRKKGTISPELLHILKTVPDHHFRLDRKVGLSQARAAARWLKRNLGFAITKATFSDYVRAKETSIPIGEELAIDFPWREDFRLGERYWGSFDLLSEVEQEAGYAERELSPRLWTPNGGESLRIVALHARSLFDTLHREQEKDNSLFLSHGEFVLVVQSLIEHWDEDTIRKEIARGVPNCGLVHYTRLNPRTGEETKSYRWKRRICPWDRHWEDDSWNGEWQEIVHRTFSNAELAAEVARFAHYLPEDRPT